VRILGQRFAKPHRPRRTRKRIVAGKRRAGVIGLALVALITLAGGNAEAKRSHEPSTGLDPIHFNKPAPNFLYDSGDGLRSLSQLSGQPVLVHFWDTWCHPCTDELPLIDRAHKEDPDLVVITLSDEQPGVARAYLKKQGIDLPVSEDMDHKVWSLFGVQAIPVSVFVRPDGTVEHVSVGAMDWNEIAEALAGLGHP
jgi:thiol-disulfide isomerase/thioredoxin